MEWYEILLIILAGGALLFGGAFWRKFDQTVKVMRELADSLEMTAHLVDKAAEALKDRKVTKAEAVLLLKAWHEASTEFIQLYKSLQELLPASAIKFLFRR